MAAMTGDEIRGANFALAAKGYDVREVNGWLSDVATCLDARTLPATVMPPPRFGRRSRGYDIDGVDQFVCGLGFDSRGVADEPEGGNLQRRRQYARDCDAEWRRVSALPGTRLRWRDVRARRGTLASGHVVHKDGEARQWVGATTGDPVLWVVGTHRYYNDAGAILFPDGRWLRFPVQGSKLGNGVMTAVNESGVTVLWFRKVGLPGDWRGPLAVEVILSPDCEVTKEILCVTALAMGWLVNYFVQPH